MKAEPLRDYVLTEHARSAMERRGLAEDVVHAVVKRPEQRYSVRPGRDVFQARAMLGTPLRRYVVRVFVDVDRSPAEVVTAYRTSKVDKYWRSER